MPGFPGDLTPAIRRNNQSWCPGHGVATDASRTGKVLMQHLFFLPDPHSEHQEITGETNDEDYPRPHNQCEST